MSEEREPIGYVLASIGTKCPVYLSCADVLTREEAEAEQRAWQRVRGETFTLCAVVVAE